MRSLKLRVWTCVASLFLAATALAGPFMGEYEGTFRPDNKLALPAVAKVVDEGDGYYRCVIHTSPKIPIDQGAYIEIYGKEQGPQVLLWGRAGGYQWQGEIKSAKLVARSSYGQYFELEKIESKSPLAGLKPPPGAVVLLGFKENTAPDMSGWVNKEWQAMDNGSMQCAPGKGANRTKQQFGDIKQLHIEFKLPLEPHGRGQGRANSGVYLSDAYEVQVLDSFGLVHTSGDCGGIYNLKRAAVNASLPPETWQTYDIKFRAARLDADGEVIEHPRITVVHNGITIHEDLEIPRDKHRLKGPLQLQDHGHPIQFRNIWVLE